MDEIVASDETWCVYMHVNLINNKVYVGQTSKKPPEHRWGRGSGYREDTQPVFYRAIQKYGWDNFEHRIVSDNLTKEGADQMEIELIAQYRSNCIRYNNPSYGYNMTDGGEGHCGYKHSEETKKKLSQHAKERFSIPENTPMFGRTHTEEARKRIGDGHRDPPEETRKKMSESAKARCTDEWRQKMSEKYKEILVGENNPMFGKKHTKDSKDKMKMSNRNRKSILQYNLNGNLLAEYDSIREAERETGVSRDVIKRCYSKGVRQGDIYDWKLKEENVYEAVC